MAGEYSLGTATLRIHGDRSSLDRELELLKRYTAQLERQGIKVKFDADTGGAERQVDGLTNKLNGLQGLLDAINQGLRGNGDVFKNLAARMEGASEASEQVSAAAGAVPGAFGKAGGAVAGLAGKFGPLAATALRAIPVLGQIGLAVQGLTAIFNGAASAIQGMLAPLERLAAEAGRFNKQVAEAGIFTANSFAILGEDGQVVEGTANQMRAVRGVISSEYKKIQKEVAQISGATASEIYEGFNIILQNAGNLGKEGQDIGKIRNLSTRIAAGMNTLGVPGYQLRSEVNALMMGNVGPDSMLAKKLGYTSSADIQQLQAQGKFYDDLINKLNKLYDGQTVLAGSLSNVKSNFQDVAQTIQSEGGQALERGLAVGLKSVLEPLDQLQGSFMMFIRGTNEALEPLLKMLGQVSGWLVSIGSILSSVLAFVMDVAAVVTNLVGLSLGPVLEGIGKVLMVIAKGFELAAKAIGGILRPLSGILRVATDMAKDSAIIQFLDWVLKSMGKMGEALDENLSKLADGGRAMARRMAEQKELNSIMASRPSRTEPLTEQERKRIKTAGDTAVSNYNQTVGDNQEVSLKSLQYSQQTERVLDERSKRMGQSQGERNLAIARDIAKVKEDTYRNEIKQLEMGLRLMQAQRSVVQEQNNASNLKRQLEEQRIGFATQLAVSPETKLDAQQRLAEVQNRNEMARIDEQAKLLETEKDIQRTQLQIQLKQQKIQQEQLKIQQLEIQIQKDAAFAAMNEARDKLNIAKGTELKAAQRAYNELKNELRLRGDQLILTKKLVTLSFQEEGLIQETSKLERQALETKLSALDTQRQMTMEQLQQKTLLTDYERKMLSLNQALEDQEKKLQGAKQELQAIQESEQRRLQTLEQAQKLRESELELLRAQAKAEQARADNALRLAEAQERAREDPRSVSSVIGAEIEALAQGQRGYVSILDATKQVSDARMRSLKLEHEAQRAALEVQRQRELSEQRIQQMRLEVIRHEVELLKSKVAFQQAAQGINRERDQRAAAAGGLPPPPVAPPAGSGSRSTGAVGNMLPRTRGGPNENEGVGWSARRGRHHNGQDLGLDVGDPIHSRRAGTVARAYGQGFGRVGGAVVVNYDDGTQGTYGHVDPSVRVGQTVSAGQRIATVTNDGQNTHLHYELRDGFGKLLNPLNAIRESLAQPAGTRDGEGSSGATAAVTGTVNSATLAQQDLANVTQQLDNQATKLTETEKLLADQQAKSTEILENQIKALQERQALELRQLMVENKRNELTAQFLKQPWNKLMAQYTETFVDGFGGMVRQAVQKAREEGGFDLGELMTDVLESMADRYIESTLNFIMAPVEKALTKGLFSGLTGFDPNKIEQEAEQSVGPGSNVNSPEQTAGNTMVSAATTMNQAADKMLQAATGSPTAPGSGEVVPLGAATGIANWAKSTGGQMYSSAADLSAWAGEVDMSKIDTSFEAASGGGYSWADTSNVWDSAVWSTATEDMGALSETAASLGEKMDKVPEQADKANEGFGSVLGGIGGLAMGVMGIVGGISQMGKGGTYNTLMGLAGIFGGIGGLAGGLGSMFKASGGPVEYGRTYVVGEEGPELFVPGQSGTIVANNKIRQTVESADAVAFSESRKALSPDGSSPSPFNETRSVVQSTSATSPFKDNREALQANQQRAIDDRYAKNSKLSIKYESQVINSVEYVTADQFRKGMNESAERGRALAFQTMQNSVSTRRRLGL
jgi:murein DD-endopeptidase MepM/ murein hydrolase activator NlpD